MKTIGLLGGLTWESSAEYYRLINEMVFERLGGRHSAEMIMASLDFDPVNELMKEQNWDGLAEILAEKALALQACGAECLLIACNTLHNIADRVAGKIDIELINVIDVIGAEIRGKNMKCAGLMGSTYTMKMDFYRKRLKEKFDIQTVIPEERDMELIMEIIENELGKGEIKDSSRHQFLRVMGQMAEAGAEGIILGCTEIPLLVKQPDTEFQLFDSTFLHSAAAVEFSLGTEGGKER